MALETLSRFYPGEEVGRAWHERESAMMRGQKRGKETYESKRHISECGWPGGGLCIVCDLKNPCGMVNSRWM
jgi:hypothetical protein